MPGIIKYTYLLTYLVGWQSDLVRDKPGPNIVAPTLPIFETLFILYNQVVIGFQVTWRKVGDLYPMTIGLSRFVSDPRITVSYDERLREWRLIINDVRRTDDGVYKCQVNTKDDQSNFYSFYVQVKSMSVNQSALCVSLADVCSEYFMVSSHNSV